MKAEGKVWRYGDNVDTDVIIPARYLNSFDPKELASHCMVDIDETFAKEVKAGDIMVGGKNFGCGSSREHAPIAIKASGVPVVVAASFARIFYRNGINIGLPLLEIGDEVEKIKADDELTKTIKHACDLMRIHFLDHVIITDGQYYSYHELGKC